MGAQPKHDPAGDAPAIPAFAAPLGALVGAFRTCGLALPRGRSAGEQPARYLLRVGGGVLTVGATDGAVYVEAILPVDPAETNGAVLLPAEVGEYLAQLGTAGRDATVRAARSKRPGRLALAIGGRAAEFAVQSPDEYAAFPEPSATDPVAVPTAAFAAALVLARAAIGHDNDRTALGTVRLSLDGDGLALAAADGAKAARAVVPLADNGPALADTHDRPPAGGATPAPVSRAALLPRRGAELLDRLLAQAGREGRGQVALVVPPPGGATLVLACGPTLRAAIRLQEGHFPPLVATRARVPIPSRVAATVLVADLLAAARRCAVVAGEDEGATVALTIRDEAVLLTGKGDCGTVVSRSPPSSRCASRGWRCCPSTSAYRACWRWRRDSDPTAGRGSRRCTSRIRSPRRWCWCPARTPPPRPSRC